VTVGLRSYGRWFTVVLTVDGDREKFPATRLLVDGEGESPADSLREWKEKQEQGLWLKGSGD